VSKRIITEKDVEALATKGLIEVDSNMIVTPLAREHAARQGIRLVYAQGSVPSAESFPRDPISGSRGPADDRLKKAIADEVVRALSSTNEADRRFIPSYSPLADSGAGERIAAHQAGEPNRAIVVATGKNQPGMAAAITSAISDCGTDIQDISQTIVSNFFSMIFIVNLDTMKGGMNFKEFKNRVEVAGRAVGAEMMVMHEAIMKAMHRI
jgi:ACT domain-containing protein